MMFGSEGSRSAIGRRASAYWSPGAFSVEPARRKIGHPGPQRRGLPIADLEPSEPNIMEELAGQDATVAASIPGGDRVTPASRLAEPNPAETGPKVPNFRGKSMRAVVEQAGSMGLPVLIDGSGIARDQVPQAGAVLHQGERIRVMFAR